MIDVRAESRYPCPVCTGLQGWGRSSGYPAREPDPRTYARSQWVMCMYCGGDGLVPAIFVEGVQVYPRAGS